MKRVFILLTPLFLLTSCASYKYSYKVFLENPIKSNQLFYENDTLSASFKFSVKGLSLELYNKIDEGIRINWDELSVSENGNAKRIVHKETGMTKVNDLQPPTTIPPKTKLEDFIVASDNIRFANIYGKTTMIVKDVYPDYDYGNKKTRERILKLKGQRVTLFFPFYIKNIYYSKVFDFYIQDISFKKG